ncbi:hypothetical protein GOP47_0028502 [Adiantum capillus-veneris]|nr:hypothetical protein GOP47_0028502 [Adiantum capillus-veneris]
MAPAVTSTTASCVLSSSHTHQQSGLHRNHHIQHQPLHSNVVLAHAKHNCSCVKDTSIVGRIAQVHGTHHINKEMASLARAHVSGRRCQHHEYFQQDYNGTKLCHFVSHRGVAPIGSLHGRSSLCFHESNKMDFVPSTTILDRNWAISKRRRQYRILAVSADASMQTSKNKDVAILWFKKDLRLDDHVGLSISTAYQALLPVYVFDPHLLRGWSNDMLEALVEAVAELKFALQGVGSDLIIRRGNVKAELTSLAAEIHATAIIAEDEVEQEWRETLSCISENSLKDSITGPLKVDVETWKAPLYECKGKPIPRSYQEFKKMQCPVKPPLQAPTSLPALAEVIDKGSIPSVSSIEDDVTILLQNNIWHKKLTDLRSNSADSLLNIKDDILGPELPSQARNGAFDGLTSWREKYILASPYEALEKRREELALSSKVDEIKRSSGVGATSIKGTLDAYLRFLEPTRRQDWRLIHDAVSEAEYYGPRGASFRTLFSNSLALGTLSRRRVYHEAFEYEKDRNGGFSSPFGFSTFTAKAAVDAVKSSEWYRMLAAASEEDSKKRGWHARVWCWRGFLIQYVVVGEHGLPVVLVHGFGAFWEHYRNNIQSLAEGGNRVWALTLLGFGRSEKPDVAYTELLWAELLRDFIVEVVGEPAILAGNSIGGYMVSMVAGLWPQIVKSLILLNTAGAILPDHLSCIYTKPSARTGVTWAGSQLSLTYLRSAASQLLKKYYCVNPSRVDEWLISEILRASHDPGAAIVLESFYCLKNPFPINWFLDRYTGKVFVIQGSKDPLSNSTQRKKLFESYCRNAVVELVNAGHCPHDEIPDELHFHKLYKVYPEYNKGFGRQARLMKLV